MRDDPESICSQSELRHGRMKCVELNSVLMHGNRAETEDGGEEVMQLSLPRKWKRIVAPIEVGTFGKFSDSRNFKLRPSYLFLF